jgi:hypothetical protein
MPIYAKKPEPKPKNPPTPEHHVILGDSDNGPIYWEGYTNVKINKKGVSIRVFFNNEDPNVEEYSVTFMGNWPGVLDATEGPITVIGSDHLGVGFWWERAQQIQLARMSLAFFDANGDEWLLKAEGFEITEDVVDNVYTYTITFSGFSLTKFGNSIEPYAPLVPPIEVTLSVISNS